VSKAQPELAPEAALYLSEQAHQEARQKVIYGGIVKAEIYLFGT
jgi:hypothetical protein